MFCSRCGNSINKNDKFCSKCGNKLIYETNIQQCINDPNFNASNNFTNYYNSNNFETSIINNNQNKKKVFIGIGVGIGVVLVILFCAITFRKTNYYFSDVSYGENNEINNNNSVNQNKSKYKTVIITDNIYSGVKINDINDANKLIKEDSEKQKDSCPSEIKNIENNLISKYGITAVNLCEMDNNFAKELDKVFEKIYSEYPSIRGYLTNFSLVNASMAESFIAAFMPIFTFATSNSPSGYPMVVKTQILLNTTYFLNKDRLEASVIDGSNSGHFPPNATPYSPVAHELGHYLSFLAMMNHYDISSILLIDNNNINGLYKIYDDFKKGSFSLSMIEEAYDKYKKDTNTTLSIDEWRGTISQYALAKDNEGNYIYDETIAEAFHDVYLNGDNAAEASKYVVNVLKQKLEG